MEFTCGIHSLMKYGLFNHLLLRLCLLTGYSPSYDSFHVAISLFIKTAQVQHPFPDQAGGERPAKGVLAGPMLWPPLAQLILVAHRSASVARKACLHQGGFGSVAFVSADFPTCT